ncbi:zinc finger MYM-type protein 1-like [Arctopsyche grandis]|uniref:zinc finger MYM-type protein 1-like n=1 Tax=Arctopsyche grandis TaxID=121162 RepID=UPI00406D6E68
MEKRRYKSGSLKRKERQETKKQKSAKYCRSITDFIVPQPLPASMSSCATNNQETRNNTHGDDVLTSELQEQERNSLDIETRISASYINQPRPSTSGFIIPVSVQTIFPIVATSAHIPIVSTSDKELDITSDINSEAHDVIEPTQEKKCTTGIFQYPSRDNLKQFFAEHPFQPVSDLPFDARLYERNTMNDSVPRNWLTYNIENKCLYCSYCLAFECPKSDSSSFVHGFSDYRRISQNLAVHESTTTHVRNVHQYISVVNNGTLDNFFASSLIQKKEKVLKQRSIVMMIIDIIKMLGKQAVSFRSHRNESAYTLDDEASNHGNFLASVQLMAKYDTIIAAHVSAVQKKSYQRMKRLKHQGKAGNKGRGGLITYLSKTTVNRLIHIMKTMIQERISHEVFEAKYYSIQVDSTQDNTIIDQFSIIIRYVHKSIVYERLLSIVPCNDGTGQGLFNLLTEKLQHLNIDPKNCISDSTDGAASYHGEYNGLQSKLANMADQHVHIWCYAHVLNLVVTETTKCCVSAVSFFNLLQNLATFINGSYKRMSVWIGVVEKQLGQEKMKRLKLIGETRWSGKSNAATTIFGHFNDPTASTFVNLLTCLSMIQDSDKFDAKTKHEATYLLQSLQKFETILTAFTYLYIFETTAPLSSYLQTNCLDMFTAWSLVDTATTKLMEQKRTFHNVHSKAFEIVTICNDMISMINMDENQTLEIDSIETALPVKRQRKKKRMADEVTNDEGNSSDPLADFRITVFNLIMDRIVQSLQSRFIHHKQLYKDLSWLDPANFKIIAEKGLDDIALDGVVKFFPLIKRGNVKLELVSFASNFDILKLLLQISESEDDSSSCKTCRTCPSCVLKILSSNRLHDKAYDNLYELYKIVSTLSVTQVQCERTFSKLKIIKNRLRNTLSEENLENFMFLSIEKQMLDDLDAEEIINRYAQASKGLKRLLIYS